MPFLNVEVSELAMTAAKVAAAGSKMTLRNWVEKLILDATSPRAQAEQPQDEDPRRIVPFEDL